MAKCYIVNQYFNKFLWILKYVCCSAWNCKTLKFLHKTKDSGIVDLWLGQPNASKNGKVKSWKKEFLAKIESDDSATNERLFFFSSSRLTFFLQDDQGLKSFDRNWNFFDTFHAGWPVNVLISECAKSSFMLQNNFVESEIM